MKASELKPDRYAGTTRFDAFYRRKAQGLGTFLTREMIDARNAQKSEDLLRNYFALSPLDIEAMEVYHGLASVPPEFSPEPNDCAAIVVWTK